MRIAINGRVLIKNKLEGVGYFTFEVLKNMVTTYPDNDYLVLFDQKPDKEMLIPGVEYRVIYPPARHPLLYMIWFEITMPFYLSQWDADIFLSLDGFCSLYTKVPTVLCIHDLAYLHYPTYIPSRALWYYRNFQEKFAHKAKQIITVSEFSKQDLIQQYGLSNFKIDVVYNGSRFEKKQIEIDENVLSKYKVTADKYFIYTGSIHPRKNIELLIDAFNRFCEKDESGLYHLVLVGRNAWMTDDIMKMAKESKFADRIIFTGYLDDVSLWSLLCRATALCYISNWEGFGVPLLDAMHAKTAIICSNTTSLPEVAGSAAVLVDPQNPDQVSEAMYDLSTQPDLRRKLVEEGQIQKLKFSWLNTSKNIYNICKIVFNNNHSNV
ncbi:glycosyltransferase family 4 protein [Membranihabitans marinus]|uniref:glycosyltransferase family 4 protein n=1 Tax=Membranihabitans marinus TaxID=1227546 RepID=UPI001F254FB5|nr:glycosyltransferase family 1 protein [Membranihabitans marinus]